MELFSLLDCVASQTMEIVQEVDSARVCDVLLGKLDELMEFLTFGAVPVKKFHGIVTFFFSNSNGKTQDEEIVCIRTINMQHAIDIFPFAVNAERVLPNSSDYVPVHVNLADFLYMYSGEASAAEIAGMCMSGRVRVPWSQYSKLRAFADSFDFSTEKWDEFYALKKQQGVEIPPVFKCAKACCNSAEAIDSNWLLVSEATLSPALIYDDEWQVVNDCRCHLVPKETREQMDQLFGRQQVDSWLTTLYDQLTNKDRAVPRNVNKTVNGIREFAGKLIQVFDE